MTTYLTDRITVDPDICHGKPTIRSTRMMVKTILEYLAAGDTPDEIIAYHSWLTLEDVAACIQFAVSLMDNQYTVKLVA